MTLDADELGYLDQLYEQWTTEKDDKKRFAQQQKFLCLVCKIWPGISAALEEHKHSF